MGLSESTYYNQMEDYFEDKKHSRVEVKKMQEEQNQKRRAKFSSAATTADL